MPNTQVNPDFLDLHVCMYIFMYVPVSVPQIILCHTICFKEEFIFRNQSVYGVHVYTVCIQQNVLTPGL